MIPAGGAGTRLWPLSRKAHPKFLLDLTGSGWSLLQQTLLRLAPVAASYTIVTGAAHRAAVREQVLDLRAQGLLPSKVAVHMVVEPSGRDSMPAIGLAAALLGVTYGDDSLVGSFAADHVIENEEEFIAAVRAAMGAATAGYVATIGITPTGPSTAFGYIQPAPTRVSPGALLVEAFVEKPNAELAEEFVQAGYLWNAGMFVMNAEVLHEHLVMQRPQLARGIEALVSAWGPLDDVSETAAETGEGRREALATHWEQLERVAIDHAIAEPVAAQRGVAVAPASLDLGWSDLGDFTSLPVGADGSVAGGGEVTAIEAASPIVSVPAGKRVVVLGIDDAVIVDTPDALLVTTTASAQQVKDAVTLLASQGEDGLL